MILSISARAAGSGVLCFAVVVAASGAGAAPGVDTAATAAIAATAPQSVIAATAPQSAIAGDSGPQESATRWLGPDLEPLPLTEDELLDVLRNGEVIEREAINIGINGIDRLVLEKDGVRIRAGFRTVDVRDREIRVGDEFYLLFRDSYLFECAAYELARSLGISNVPPTVLRRIRGVDGSVQLWVEGLFEDSNDARSPDYFGWALQLSTMTFFDSLIYNVDRNPGNIQVDHDYKLWMIDHTRAFQSKSAPFQIERVNNIRRDLWDRLRELGDEDFERIFSGLLEPAQVGFFKDRKDALVKHFEALIQERGVEAVIFEPRGADGGPSGRRRP